MRQEQRRPAEYGAASSDGWSARDSVAGAGDDLLAAALRYAAQGWPVFLLGRTKRPVASCARCRTAGDEHDRQACRCLTCHGLYAATTDPERVRAMRAVVPRGLLAIRTGAASGLVVVDVDPDHGGRLDPELLPRTALVRTGSGGWHAYYRHPGGRVPNSQGRLAPGVDVRGDGGYVVAPPSIHPRTEQPYRWVGGHPVRDTPPALVAACLPPSAAAAPSSTRPTITTPVDEIHAPAALLAVLLNRARQAPQGRRQRTLFGVAHGVARIVAAGALSRDDAWALLTDAGRAVGLPDRQIRSAILGGFRDEGVPA